MRLVPLLTLPLRAAALALAQALLGPRRWNVVQLLVAVSAAPLKRRPRLRLPLPNSKSLPMSLPLPLPLPLPLHIPLLPALAQPLLVTWLYGLSARFLAPAHRRSLAFWRRVVPIYAAYKRTQVALRLSRAGPQRRAKIWNARHEWAAAKVYNLCVELRGFYLKDGQFLGARSDFVPLAWCRALRRLQDRVPPVEFAEIERTVRAAYRVNTLRQLFRRVDDVPLASATIAQVHRGEMPDGTTIALKTQYADQEALCAMDLMNLRRLASLLQRFDMSFFDMHAVVDEFERQIPAEFDFVREAEMMTRIRHNLRRAGLTDVVIPRVIPGLVARRSLAMTFMDGCRADNAAALKLWGINPDDVIKAIGRAYGQMLLCDGVAHCDPHLGNLIILRDKRVALIDFGQSKELPNDLRLKLCAFYLALGSDNRMFLLKTFLDLGIEVDVPADADEEKLADLVPVYASGLLDTAPLPPDIEINPFASNSPLQSAPIRRFNADLFMVLRTLGLLRALAETLGVERPDSWMSALFRPYARRGIRLDGMPDEQRARLSAAMRARLTSGAPSPFDSSDVDDEGVGCVFS